MSKLNKVTPQSSQFFKSKEGVKLSDSQMQMVVGGGVRVTATHGDWFMQCANPDDAAPGC